MIQWIRDHSDLLFKLISAAVGVLGLVLTFYRNRSGASVDALDEDSFVGQGPPEGKPWWGWQLLVVVPFVRPIALRKLHTEARVSNRVRITIKSTGYGMQFYKGDQSYVTLWLDVINMNPFPIKIHKISGEIQVSECAVAPIQIIDHYELPALGWRDDIYLKVPLAVGDVSTIERLRDGPSEVTAGVSLNVYLGNRIRDQMIMRRSATMNRVFTNFKAR